MNKLNKRIKWGSGFLVVAGAIIFASCSQNAKTKDGLTDPEIASIAVTANQIDVDYGNIALKKSSNEQVKHFAQTMVKDHTDIINQAVALAKKLKVTPKSNAVTKSLLDGAKKMKSNLNNLDGFAFDSTYINNEVAYHKAVISTIKEKLIPQTKNKQLKDLLTSVMPLLENHLKMAEKAQKEILSQKSGAPKLNDAQIASIVVVANKIDIAYGKTALTKSKNKNVKHFANTMITDHGKVLQSAIDLAKKLGVTPDPNNPVTKSLLAGAKKVNAKLDAASGDAFNKAYIDNEVAYHKAVISAMEKVLIPQTKNKELKQTLISVNPLFKEHLKMAEKAAQEIEQ